MALICWSGPLVSFRRSIGRRCSNRWFQLGIASKSPPLSAASCASCVCENSRNGLRTLGKRQSALCSHVKSKAIRIAQKRTGAVVKKTYTDQFATVSVSINNFQSDLFSPIKSGFSSVRSSESIHVASSVLKRYDSYNDSA